MLCELAFRNVDEYIGDLEDIVYVGLNAVPPFLHLVLVASDLYDEDEYPLLHFTRKHRPYLKPLSPLLESDNGDIRESSEMVSHLCQHPLQRKTYLIWLDGCWIGIARDR